MRRFALVGVMLMAAGLSVSCSSDNSDEVFEAVLAGSNENPARASSGNGRSHVVIHGDTVSYSVEIDDISNVTLSHIHVGPATANGPVRVNFYNGPTISTTDKMILASGSFGSGGVTGITYDQLLAEIRNGNAYVNVHTTQFPGGEIRGQLRRIN
jgi:hypothetical protein